MSSDNQVEVDMVPLIDIISLLLMFLVMVGDMAKSTSSVQMKLPRASEAKHEKDPTINTHNRIVVQLKKDPKEAKYWAVVENNQFELVQGGNNKSLISYLEQQIAQRMAKGMIPGPNGEIPFPVKLRIPADAPMREAERLIMTLAQAKLVNVHYAVEESKK